jgi:hypothetical protein
MRNQYISAGRYNLQPHEPIAKADASAAITLS